MPPSPDRPPTSPWWPAATWSSWAAARRVWPRPSRPARNGASVTLLERYAYLGGLAAGGLVLVLDDFADGAAEITVRGIAQEMVERLETLGLAVYAPPGDRILSDEMWRRWSRWGVFDIYQQGPKKSIVYAVAFDPDGWKRVSNDLAEEAGIDLRLHSWYSAPILEGDTIKGVICETKAGPQAIVGDVVIDASGDADVAAGAGAPFVEGSYMVTTVFRLGNVDTDAAERFEHEQPAECHGINRAARRILGGSWALWWLKTPLPGVVWCNCPHMTGYSGLSVEDLTAADREGRKRIADLVAYVREHYPGFEKAFVVDVAPQIGVRQSRLIEGEYVVTKDDVVNRAHFDDSVARGRGYYTPYRAMLPRGVEQLLMAGRHYSVTPRRRSCHERSRPACRWARPPAWPQSKPSTTTSPFARWTWRPCSAGCAPRGPTRAISRRRGPASESAETCRIRPSRCLSVIPAESLPRTRSGAGIHCPATPIGLHLHRSTGRSGGTGTPMP